MSLNNFVRSLQNIMRGDAGINGDAQRIEQMGWMLFLKVYDSREAEWEIYDPDFHSIIPEELRWRNWAVDRKDGRSRTGQELLDFVNNELFPTLKGLTVTRDTPQSQAIVRSVFQDSNQYMKDGVLLRQVVNVIDAVDFGKYEESHAFGEIYETILKDLQSAGNAGEFYTPRAVTDFMVGRLAPKLGERVADFAAGTCGFLTSALDALSPQAKTIEGRDIYRRSVYGIEKKPMPYLLGITNLLLHGIDAPEFYHGNSLERNVRELEEEDKFDVILMNPPYGGTEQRSVQSNFPAEMRSSETADLFMALATYRLKRGGRAAIIIPDGFLFGTDGPKVAIKKRLLEEFNLHTIVRLPAGVFSPYTSITTNLVFFEDAKPTQDIWFYRVPLLPGNKPYSKTRPFTLGCFDDCVQWWNDRKELFDGDRLPTAIKKSAQEIQDAGYNLDFCGYATKADIIPSPHEAFTNLQCSFNVIQQNLTCLKEALNGNGGGLLTYLNRIEEIQEQFNTNKDVMRKSVLQAAIEGKLTQREPGDGDARDLLAEIQEEKARLVREGKIRKSNPLPPVDDDEMPFDIPENWCWVRLAALTKIISKGTTPHGGRSVFVKDGIPFLRVENINDDGTISHDGIMYVTEETHLNFLRRSILEERDVLVSIAGTLAKTGIIKEHDLPMNVNQAIAFIRLCSKKIDEHYIKMVLDNPTIQNLLLEKTKVTAIPNLTLEIVSNCFIPLPPLAEQRRIVARLEKLLPLVDELGKMEKELSDL